MPVSRSLTNTHAHSAAAPEFKFFLLYTLVALLLVTGHSANAEIVVDGRADEAEWQEASSCGDWRRTTPFVLDEPRHGNDLRVIATPQGFAASFVIDQPASVRRMKPRTPRDAEELIGDTVNLIVDFDATGQVGYEFSVALGGGVRDGLLTNQNEFDRDWDGVWQHAVRETDDQWFVEILIPWSTISMRESGGERRTVGLYASRYLFDRNEEFACPGISKDAAVFMSDFRKLEISRHSAQALFDFVPYGTAITDNVSDRSDFKAGVDISWKPSAAFSLSAALNPDFGQVESDELVVDFSAIETVFTDRRPFFTENQGIFDLRTPANGQLIYTRRIGAAPDDASAGSSDIDAALKITGTANRLVYGAFAAQEDGYEQDAVDSAGRLFGATRLTLPFERARIGHLATWTDRPFLERDALVNALDFEVTPGASWRIAGQGARSDIDARGVRTDGYQSWLQADFNPPSALTHSMKLLFIDDEFDVNDLGYMERNALRQAEWETNRRVANASSGRISGETQRLYLQYRENTDGQRLQSRIQLSRDVRYASAWTSYQEVRAIPNGVDDLLSRGNGPVRLDSRYAMYLEAGSPRVGDWTYLVSTYAYQKGVSGYSAWAQFVASWYPYEDLTLRLSVVPYWSEDWLLWQEDNLFGSFRENRLDWDFRLDWIPAPRHELRIKWQWIGINAKPQQAYRTDARGELNRSPDQLLPFTVSNLGFQVRYRYELGPLSDLFLVYGRGGFQSLDEDERSVGTLFHDMTDVRNADQFLIKLRYRL